MMLLDSREERKIVDYLDPNIKDSEEIMQLLERDKIQNIENKNFSFSFKWPRDYNFKSETEHDCFLKQYFKIDDKNKVLNMKYLFFSFQTIEEYFCEMPLKEIFIVNEDDDINLHQHVILPYIKIEKYFHEIFEPFKQALVMKTSSRRYPLALNNEKDALELIMYQYIDDNERMYIIEADHHLKNPLFGIHQLWNLVPNLFDNQSILLYKKQIHHVNKDIIFTIRLFFRNIISENFIFHLKCNDEYRDKTFNLSFFSNIDHQILSVEKFPNEFLINVFKSLYDLEETLAYLQINDMKLSFTYQKDNIFVYVTKNSSNKNFSFSIDNDTYLIQRILNDICNDRMTFFDKIKYFFFNYEIPRYIDKNHYAKYRNKIFYFMR